MRGTETPGFTAPSPSGRCSLLELEQTALEAGGNGFRTVGGFQFYEDCFYVRLGGVLGDAEGHADIAVGKAAAEKIEDLELPPDLPGVGAPRATPPEVIERLNQAITEALNDPDVKKRLSDLAIIPTPGSAADFGKALAAETEKWAKVVKSAGVTLD